MKAFYTQGIKWCAILWVHLFMCAQLTAQNKTIVSGTVLDEAGRPMGGVSVKLSADRNQFSRTAQTSAAGKFSFTDVESTLSFQLIFSHVGYTEKTLAGVRSGNDLTITMEPASSEIEEVVVVGYGRSTKRDVTGAVKSVKSADFNRGIINSPEELLQGKVSGVNVTSASGEPGGIQSITVRGPGGVRTGSTPLFVVDGMALDNSSTGGAGNPLAFLNPQDIESFDVLKDASATAIYGARGANGVVLITTKMRQGRLQFDELFFQRRYQQHRQ